MLSIVLCTINNPKSFEITVGHSPGFGLPLGYSQLLMLTIFQLQLRFKKKKLSSVSHRSLFDFFQIFHVFENIS